MGLWGFMAPKKAAKWAPKIPPFRSSLRPPPRLVPASPRRLRHPPWSRNAHDIVVACDVFVNDASNSQPPPPPTKLTCVPFHTSTL